MSRKKRGSFLVLTLLLAAVLVSACQQPYSTPPAATNTPLDASSLFSTPLGEPDTMTDVANFITQTALAGGPGAVIVSATPDGAATSTSTPNIVLNPTNTTTATQAVAVTTATSVPPVTNSFAYTLKRDEFPFCIARRNGVDPYDLLKASGLTSPDIYYEGLALKIPQGSSWNEATLGPRALRTDHSYTVTGNGDTSVYGVACKYGSAAPDAIAQANSISVDASLTIGQTLSIP